METGFISHCLQILLLLGSVQAIKNERLVGGPLFKACDLKYQVAIATSNEKFLCGGSIIDDYYIVTAAHCVQKPGSLYGCKNLTIITEYDGENDTNFFVIKADKAYIPAQFNIDTAVGDIAIVRLSESLNIAENRCLTKLMLPIHDNYEGEEAIVSGQGIEQIDWHLDLFKIKFETNHTARLRSLKTKIVSNADCQKTYEFGFFKFTKIRDGMLCAVPLPSDDGTEELKGACDGDSGSPLVINNTLIGVVSNGERFCDDVMYNGIYTRVFFYRDFIDKVLKEDGDNCTVISGPTDDYIDLCLVKSDTYDVDPRNLSFFEDYDLLPYYSQSVSDVLSYVKYTTVKLSGKLSDCLMGWFKGIFN